MLTDTNGDRGAFPVVPVDRLSAAPAVPPGDVANGPSDVPRATLSAPRESTIAPTTEETAAARAFLDHLPIGIASNYRIAAVRTVLVDYDSLRTELEHLREIDEALRARSAEDLRHANSLEDLVRRNAEEFATLRQTAAALTQARGTLAAEIVAQLERAEGAAAKVAEQERHIEERDRLIEEKEVAVIAMSHRLEDLHAAFGKLDNEAAAQRDRAAATEDLVRRAEMGLKLKEEENDGLKRRLDEMSIAIAAATAEAESQRERADIAEATTEERDRLLRQRSSELENSRSLTDELTRSNDTHAEEVATERIRTNAAVSLASAREATIRQRDNEILALTVEIDELSATVTTLAQDLALQHARSDTANLAVEHLVAALRPFAEMAEAYDLADAGWIVESGWCEDRKHQIIVEDFRTAREACHLAISAKPADNR